jgi:hypothetical protein
MNTQSTTNNHLSIINNPLEMANNEFIRDKAERSIKNSAGLNKLKTKDLKLKTNWSKLSTNYNLFMQNKANFKKVKFYVNKEMTRTYEQKDTWSNRTKQSQTKPNKANSKPIKANL